MPEDWRLLGRFVPVSIVERGLKSVGFTIFPSLTGFKDLATHGDVDAGHRGVGGANCHPDIKDGVSRSKARGRECTC